VELLPVKYDNPTFRKKIIQQVPEEIARLDQLLKELLDYSKGRKAQPLPFSVSELVIQVISLISPEIEKRGITINTLLDENDYVLADRSHLKQILLNLLINGMEAVNHDGHIDVIVERLENDIHIFLRDSGPGIPEDTLDEIFEPFYSTKDNGTGLGLAIVFQYVKENAGQIFVQSKLGFGTQFELIFPVCSESEALV
jgi:polar amino acid transport system substrate-binding protein